MLPPLFIKIMGNFLQILSDNIISIYIFIAFVIIQYIFFAQCQKKIGNIKKIFPRSSYSVIRNDGGIIQINTVSGYDIYNEIITKINNYISENSDCVDLNEMKDIVENKVYGRCYISSKKIESTLFFVPIQQMIFKIEENIKD